MSAFECEDIGAYYAYRDFEDRERNAKEKSKGKKKTNADRIRSMTDEELANFLFWDADGCGKTRKQWLEWLKEEVEDV